MLQLRRRKITVSRSAASTFSQNSSKAGNSCALRRPGSRVNSLSTTTLFPLTRDRRYFLGRSEVDQLGRKLPVDGKSRSKPDLRRVFGSLPWTRLEDVYFPQLRKDLEKMLASEEVRKGLVGLPVFRADDKKSR